MINYDGRKFRNTEAPPGQDAPVGAYHQVGDLVWAEASGGSVRRCALAGTSDEQGTITLGYTMVLDDGQIVVGRCASRPEIQPDGRIRLREEWERYLPTPGTGVSFMEEL